MRPILALLLSALAGCGCTYSRNASLWNVLNSQNRMAVRLVIAKSNVGYTTEGPDLQHEIVGCVYVKGVKNEYAINDLVKPLIYVGANSYLVKQFDTTIDTDHTQATVKVVASRPDDNSIVSQFGGDYKYHRAQGVIEDMP